MGAKVSTSHGEELDDSCLTDEERALSPLFCEVLVMLWKHQRSLGGLKHFAQSRPSLRHKVKKEDFCSNYSDFEYVYMTVLGFAKLHALVEEITKLNNGENFTRNPGVQLLERACGMTMHGDREGSNALLRSAPGAMLEAYQSAKASGSILDFFRKAFDRQADPCLEGRTSRLMHFAEQRRVAGGTMAPWEDVSLQPLPEDAAVKDVAGEHLRVFCNECTWLWAKKLNIGYEKAKEVRFGADDTLVTDFAQLYNADTFSRAMRARGVVRRGATSSRWEVQLEDGSWGPYDEEASATIESAYQRGAQQVELRLGPRGWQYTIDLTAQVQMNAKTKKSRPLRRVELATSPVSPDGVAAGARLTEEELGEAIRFFVEMHTLPTAPPPPPPPTSGTSPRRSGA
ncbi:Hypothetical protein SCF082_LOCUS10025 [Durusdinium trenchii]|uniref:WWE domain-containing protein n=1 Tax=Durusdinium trenchii TaxID=1381693 RepID=A0ABP0J379_9DINO